MYSFVRRIVRLSFRTRLSAWSGAAVLAVLLGGCGESQGPAGEVAGKVMLAGQPVGAGNVVFFKETGVPVAVAALSASGEFRLDERIPVGDYQVAIQSAAEAAPPTDGAAAPAQAAGQIPPKYLSETTSGLTATVKEDQNSCVFELK